MPCTKIPTSIFIDIYRSESEPVLRSKLEYWFGICMDPTNEALRQCKHSLLIHVLLYKNVP